jgi:medium-chain acyl-[acyl-carrier-protein] hydrolase
MNRSDWLSNHVPRPNATLRLFCFPYAGGGAVMYKDWARQLPEHVEVCAIEPPGRFARRKESQPASMEEFITGLAGALGELHDLPYVCFGYSLGAWMAFEWARWLRRAHQAEPRALVMAASRAPQVPSRVPAISHQPIDRFAREVQVRYGAFDPIVAADPDLRRLVISIMQVDLRLLESYACQPEAPFACPIVALGGTDDPGVRRPDLEAWSVHSSGACEVTMLGGGHFFIQTLGKDVLERVRAVL